MILKVILLACFFSLPACAASLNLCQESAAEDPFLREFTISGQAYFGQHSAVVATALQALKFDFTISRLPWRRCVSGAMNGTYDGVIGIGWSAERNSKLVFPMLDKNNANESFRLYYVNYPIYVPAQSSLTWDGIAFGNIKHGLVAPKGYLVEDKLKALKVLQLTDTGVDVGIHLLKKGRIDGVVLSEEVGDRMILDEKNLHIRKLNIAFFQQPIFLALNRNQQKLSPEQLQVLWLALPHARIEVMGSLDR